MLAGRRGWSSLVLAALGLLAVSAGIAGCSAPTAAGSAISRAAGNPPAPGTATGGAIVVGVYPLEYAAARVFGDGAGAPTVVNLAAPGVEPHDLELTASQIAGLRSARLVVHLPGLSPAIDRAVASLDGVAVLDVSAAARLRVVNPGGVDHDAASQDGEHSSDPHFWLDPTRLADAADAIAEALAGQDSGSAAGYRAGAAAVRADLTALDGQYTAGLSRCANRDLVASHAAFGYLAERYGLHQVSLAGLSPDAEVPARTLARLADYVTQHGIRTIYYERLVSPDLARTLANTTGARTAVLDPLESRPAAPADGTRADYLTVMRANLAALKEGQPCP